MCTDYHLKSCEEKDLPVIRDIFNDAILHTTALYDYKPRSLEMIQSWYSQKKKGNYPVIGIFDRQDTLMGFATYGSFRDRPAYKYTVEHSVYVHPDFRGKGYGTVLLREIIKKAEEQNYHVVIGGIDASNQASIKLHEKEEFYFCGLVKETGYKFGKWLDLVFYQKILKTPINPVEDL
jgi:phosphinothricin acetyltransferase